MAASTVFSPIPILFGSQTPSKPSVPIHCPTYPSRPLPLPIPATKLTDPAPSTSTATTLSNDKHRIIVGAPEVARMMICKPSNWHLGLGELADPDLGELADPDLGEFADPDLGELADPGILVLSKGNLARLAALNNPKRIIINPSGKFVEYQFPAGRRTIKKEPPDVLLVCPDVDPQILPCAGLGNMHPRFGVGYEKLLWFLDAARTHPDELYTVGDYGYLGTTVTTILPCAGLGNMNPRFGVGYEKLLWFLDAAQTHPDELYTVGDYGYLGTTVTTVDYFGDAGSPPVNHIDGIQARSSYLTVGGLGINHYNGGIIPPTPMNLNNTACDFVPSQGGPLMIEHTNGIFRRISSHQILWISLLMAGSLFFFNPSIRSIIKIIISFIHSSDGNYINLDALMSLMQFFGLRRQSSAALFCSVGIASETRKSPFKLMSMMMEVAWFLLGSFKGSKHDLVNSALDLVKEKFATQKIPPPNNLLQLKFSLDFVISGGGCTQISLFMVAIFLVGILFTVLVESSKKKTMDESSLDAFTHIYDTDQHPKLCAEIPKDSKLRDRGFLVKIKADIQNHGEGKYNDQLHVRFDPVFSSRESVLLIVTCKVRAKDKDEYKESMSHLQLIVERAVKDAQVFHGETWPVQVFHGET